MDVIDDSLCYREGDTLKNIKTMIIPTILTKLSNLGACYTYFFYHRNCHCFASLTQVSIESQLNANLMFISTQKRLPTYVYIISINNQK